MINFREATAAITPLMLASTNQPKGGQLNCSACVGMQIYNVWQSIYVPLCAMYCVRTCASWCRLWYLPFNALYICTLGQCSLNILRTVIGEFALTLIEWFKILTWLEVFFFTYLSTSNMFTAKKWRPKSKLQSMYKTVTSIFSETLLISDIICSPPTFATVQLRSPFIVVELFI